MAEKQNIALMGKTSTRAWNNIETHLSEKYRVTRVEHATEALEKLASIPVSAYVGDMITHFGKNPIFPTEPENEDLKRIFHDKSEKDDFWRQSRVTASVLTQLYGTQGKQPGTPVFLATNYVMADLRTKQYKLLDILSAQGVQVVECRGVLELPEREALLDAIHQELRR